MPKTETVRPRRGVELAPFDRIVDTLGSKDRRTVTVRGGSTYDDVLGKGGVRGRVQVIQATRGGLTHSEGDPVRVPSLPRRNYIPTERQMP